MAQCFDGSTVRRWLLVQMNFSNVRRVHKFCSRKCTKSCRRRIDAAKEDVDGVADMDIHLPKHHQSSPSQFLYFEGCKAATRHLANRQATVQQILFGHNNSNKKSR